MARPKEFDRDEALDVALRVFRAKGFEGTTTDDLRLAMKIGRQSMYDTFGDKRQLYLEALRRYHSRSILQFMESLETSSSPQGALRDALGRFANQDTDDLALGCMGINAVCEFGRSDAQVNSIIDAGGSAFIVAFKNLIAQGKEKGEFRSDLDEDKAAAYLLSILSGMKVSARAGASTESIIDIASFAVQALVA
ncbi:TetR/AcrR family transcriptional regulator [Pseudomonas fluorescens]|uniref:TetR/AcrR family transcriptional regulator n=1 Tax=Pseudomonas fluorescens TaxID=294 RepID=UPI001241B668|nr:TetR/AcrR family transcriptional regulator [Pseudomonas fluorescens]VVN43923.1 HTH-type transcriptional repressor ComR [Pseudomonas fluorescens]